MALNHKRLKMSEDASCSTNNKEILFDPIYFETSDFSQIVKSPGFVDKTLLLKVLIPEMCEFGQQFTFIAAPPRFGKSTNMDMIKKFLEIQVDENGTVIDEEDSSNYQIFKDNNLFIFQNKDFFDKHFAIAPVLYLSLKPVTGDSYDQVLNGFRIVLHKAYEQHQYLLKSDKLCKFSQSQVKTFKNKFDTCKKFIKIDFSIGLNFLLKCLYTHFDKRVIVLIDDYDAPIINTIFKKNIDIDKVDGIVYNIFINSLDENEYVSRVLLTGVSYFACTGQRKMFNNVYIGIYKFLIENPFVPYYGLTEDEVSNLLTKFKIDDETKEKVKLYYNVYLSTNGIKLSSIWSILHFLHKKEIKNDWEESGEIIQLKEAMNVPIVRSNIETLCLGLSVNLCVSIYHIGSKLDELQKICSQKASFKRDYSLTPGIYLSFLLQQGYLTFEKQVEKPDDNDKLYGASVIAPNIEIVSNFRKSLLNYYDESINSCIENCAVSFEKLSSSTEKEIFHDFITKFNELLAKVKNEFTEITGATYYCIMFFILCKTKFSFITESTNPIVDLVVHADDVGIVIEFDNFCLSSHPIKADYSNVFKHNPCYKHITKCIYVGIRIHINDVADINVLVDCT